MHQFVSSCILVDAETGIMAHALQDAVSDALC